MSPVLARPRRSRFHSALGPDKITTDAATMYLLERGVRLTGTDGWSWDAPFVHMAKKYGESKDASLIWDAG